MKTNMNGNEISDRIKKYFNSVGVNTIVTKKQLNAAGEETDVAEEIKTIEFVISLDRLVSAPSTASMTLMKATSKSTFDLKMNSQVSNPPMSGQW
jgi:hypothetical protein